MPPFAPTMMREEMLSRSEQNIPATIFGEEDSHLRCKCSCVRYTVCFGFQIHRLPRALFGCKMQVDPPQLCAQDVES